MKVIVCGSIGYGGKEEIIKLQELLKSRGYEVINQLEVDYSDVGDFRDRKDLWDVVKRDLELCSKADVIVLIVKYPSFGAMAEVVISKMKGKKVIAYCPCEVKSPWPLYFSDCVARSEEELLNVLSSFKEKTIKIGVIPCVYRKHEMELVYRDFTCICPVTGRRDRATITIRYRPRDKILEYESLKQYFEEFRDRVMHHEAVVEKIYTDIEKILNPEWLEVVAEFEERSGVRAKVRLSS